MLQLVKKKMLKKQKLLMVFILGLAFFALQETTPYAERVALEYNTQKFPAPDLPADNPQSREGIKLGRLLFYEKMLSGNDQQACASCHLQSKSFTDGKKLAIGTNGAINTKNSMALINLAWSKEFFWDGRMNTLEALVIHPLTDSLEMDEDTSQLIKQLRAHDYYPKLFEAAFPGEHVSIENLSKAIAQFIRSITAEARNVTDSITHTYELRHDVTADKGLNFDLFKLDPEDYVLTKADTQVYETYRQQKFSSNLQTEASFRGMYFRLGMMCTPCHTGESFGGALMANNLIDSSQTEKFKVPSLINVLHTAPYMHDGRFTNVDSILVHYDKTIHKLHEVNAELGIPPIPNLITEYDKQHFKDFLKTFTDSTVMKNKKWSDPFAREDFNWSTYMK